MSIINNKKSLDINNFRIERLQLVLFFTDIIRNVEVLSSKIVNDLKIENKQENDNFYTQQSVIYIKKNKTIAFGPDRVDYICRYDETTDDDYIKNIFFDNIYNISRSVCKFKSISRIGIISNLFINDDNPSSTLTDKFFRLKKTKDSDELSIRYNKRELFSEANINNIYIFEAINNFRNKKIDPRISITRDINCDFNNDGIDINFIKSFIDNYKMKILYYER